MKDKIYDLIIIGGGPGGMTAGMYAGRQKMNTLLITKDFGGQMADKSVDICNYPGFESISGTDLIKRFKEHLLSYEEVVIERDEVLNVEKEKDIFFITTSSKKNFQSRAIIVASGADPRPLEVPGEKDFLGKGVSYCPHCDGPLFRDKDVVVVGGGNSAFEAALFLSNYVNKVYILEYGPEVVADKRNQELVEKTGKAEIITSAKLKEILGDKFVESVVYEDKEGEKELEVSAVFVEIGYQPATAFVRGLVLFTKRDEIIVEYETCQTKTEGLFAVGDCNAGKFKQIVTAAGEGAKAALSAYEYLKNE